MPLAAPAPARLPRDPRDQVRLLVVEPGGRLRDTRVTCLPALLAPGDLVVVNDAATMPASLSARTQGGEELELRLAGQRDERDFLAVAFGPGDWRTPTEERGAPPPLAPGDRLSVGALVATVTAVELASRRLVRLRFDRSGADLWGELYARGRPIQYAHLDADLPLHAVQTAFGGRPLAAEMPSAGRPLSWAILLELRRRGIALTRVTHAAGLSSTGDPALDRALPLAERYHIPAGAVSAIEAARAAGGRVIAVGTTTARALEGSVRAGAGRIRPGPGETGLVLGAHTRPQVVDGIVSGIHEPGESHFELLCAFAPAAVLEAAWRVAGARGYLRHEFGDLCLVLPGR